MLNVMRSFRFRNLETITLFVTDFMLLVKDCNYIDEDRQVGDQFVCGVSDDDLKKKLLEKGNALT